MTKKSGKILIADDDQDVLTAASLLLKQHFDEVLTVKNPELIPALLEKNNPDVIILDMNFKSAVNTGNEGFYWLKRILTLHHNAVVILFTAYGDVEMAVRAVKEGATDFVLKPWQNEKFISTINAALELSKTKKSLDDLQSKQKHLIADNNQPSKEIIGESKVIQEIFKLIEKVAKTDANVLILGENGTGKDLIARAIHNHSHRKNEAIVSVDLGAVSESLFESELFGHKKGAFTDAKEDRKGRFEIASGGTLFLDEIGNLNLAQQAKLLSVLQNREIFPVGSNTPVKIDVRLICATNASLQKMVDKKAMPTGRQEFRQDLYFRIKTVEIHIPPLRERPEDIPLLTRHFFEIYRKKYRKNISGIEKTAGEKLKNYQWPGNIRELQHCIERAVIMCEQSHIRPEDLMINPSTSETSNFVNSTSNLEDIEKGTIQKVLSAHEGNISAAAKELGLTRAALYRRIEKYGL